MTVHIHYIYVKFVGLGQRSNFKIIGGKAHFGESEIGISSSRTWKKNIHVPLGNCKWHQIENGWRHEYKGFLNVRVVCQFVSVITRNFVDEFILKFC